MQKITANQLKQVVKHVVLRLHEPVMIEGQFGSGKTEVIKQACEEEGALCHPVLLGQYDTVDLRGSPWVGDLAIDYQATIWHPASTLPFVGNPNFPTDRPIVLFLDERTSATVPVMGICYQLVNEHCVGEHLLMPNVRIISAGNRAIDKGIVNREPMPLCNRETRYEFEIDMDQWCIWAQGKYGDDAAIFIAYHQFRSKSSAQSMLCTYDPAKGEKCVATPRTWEKSIKYFRDDIMPLDIKQASIAGAVGNGPAADFWGFNDSWRKIAKYMPKILKDPEKASIPEEASLQYALAVCISGTLHLSNVHLLHVYLLRMPPEFNVLAWQLAIKRDTQLFECDQFLDFSHKYKVIFN